ncbi:hypothetical protein [Cochlodiniinecator piscidefendens]|uniref:hypothetical protein n=1 Tax=Cochlodiniinecator piscidefendens TaxID=2715756 RepID=UPI00140A3B09|nr:hypothetical protein [Cochlodiniinecator piscidefendens]
MQPVRYNAPQAILLGLIFSIAIAAFFLIFRSEAAPLLGQFQHGMRMYALPPTFASIASFLLGMGIGSQVSLLWTNANRLRAVFRPNKGRVISALVLALVTPFSILIILPVTFLFSLLVILGHLADGRALPPESNWTLLTFGLVALPLAYVFASLIISGVRGRGIRVLLFAQVWLAIYSAVLLSSGFSTIDL